MKIMTVMEETNKFQNQQSLSVEDTRKKGVRYEREKH